jgi:hypothetical protein
MKAKNFIVVALIIVIGFSFSSCKKNVVTDFPAVHQWDTHAQATWDTIKKMPQAEILPFVKKEVPNLVPTLLSDPIFKGVHVDSIYFSFGSGKAEGVVDSTGATHDGVYKKELIANFITTPAIKGKNPIKIFVTCLNGAHYIQGDEVLGGMDLGFRIARGEGLANHLPELQAWGNAAGDLNVPIKNQKGKIVSEKTYMNYLGQYETVLFEDDFVNLYEKKVYNKKGQEVDFERRLIETEIANRERRDILIAQQIRMDIQKQAAKKAAQQKAKKHRK